MGSQGLATPVGALCRWSNDFVYILYQWIMGNGILTNIYFPLNRNSRINKICLWKCSCNVLFCLMFEDM